MEAIPLSAVLLLPKHGILLSDSTAGSEEPVRHRKDSDDIKAASLLSLETKAPFAVSSVEAGGKQTLQRALSMTGPWQHGRFCIALCIGFCKKALGLRLVSTLLALKAKHKQVLLKQQVEFSPGMFKQAFLERKNPVYLYFQVCKMPFFKLDICAHKHKLKCQENSNSSLSFSEFKTLAVVWKFTEGLFFYADPS